MQYAEKSSFYQNRYLRGMLEHPDSHQRILAMNLHENKLKYEVKQDKYTREGFKIERMKIDKVIDCTDTYKKAMDIIRDINGEYRQMISTTNREELLTMLSSRRCGDRLARTTTPVHRLDKTSIMSPSHKKTDMMLLPGVSL